MHKLLRYWGIPDLTGLLNGEDPSLLKSLEQVLPAVLSGNASAMNLYTRDNLIRIAEAFLPAEIFAATQFRSNCLNRLPPDELAACARAVSAGVEAKDFNQRRDRIAQHRWSGPFAEKFVRHFDLPEHFLPAEQEIVPSFVDLDPPTEQTPFQISSRFKQLKDYQFSVYEQSRRKLLAPRARFVVQMPTGSGKTRTAMETVCELLNASSAPPIVIWLAHSEELCEQGFQCFLDVWPHLATRPLRAHRCWGTHPLPELDESKASFVAAGFQKLHAAIKNDPNSLWELKDRATLIIVDEAHKTEAPTYKEVITCLQADQTRTIGLTATPGRTIEEETQSLSEFYFNQIVELPAGEDEGVIGMLRERGILSNAHYVPILTEINITLTPQQRQRVEERFDLPAKLLAELGANDLRNVEIIKRLHGECKKGRRILLFACSVAHSKFLTSVMLFLGIKAGHVDGDTEQHRRRALIEEFKEGELQVLCNFGVLTTGFDAPNTDVVFITRPTTSPVLYSQMIGRGLRGPEIGGSESCTIIDVRDNIIGFGDADRVYDYFEDYWAN